MKTTLVVFGSTTGSCEDYASRIASRLDADVANVADVDVDTLNRYPHLVLGTSTWGSGDLQDDWYDGVSLLQKAGLKDKTIALFGCGDAESYPDTFCGGMSALYNAVKDSGAKLVGPVDASTYTYDDSESVVDGQFVGLALDVNESDDEINRRIDNWVAAIKPEL